MSKPTPGANRIKACNVGYRVCVGERTVAIFARDGYIKDDQARANAEAWIAGVAAIEKLAKVRDVIVGYEGDKFSEEAALFQIRKIIDES